ncbi:MAG: F0F1 ATP synthase subunit epsilon, partial [Gracilibacteraceae bacterium]|nr:F0F1 ATP synthase subunit epsilon [Gracilibacteraceae bacterium]
LAIGVLRYEQEGRTKKISIGGGFLEVEGNQAIVLAKTAETEDMIDPARAAAAKERAERRLQSKEGMDTARAEAALKRAVARLQILGK